MADDLKVEVTAKVDSWLVSAKKWIVAHPSSVLAIVAVLGAIVALVIVS